MTPSPRWRVKYLPKSSARPRRLERVSPLKMVLASFESLETRRSPLGKASVISARSRELGQVAVVAVAVGDGAAVCSRAGRGRWSLGDLACDRDRKSDCGALT